MNRGSNRLTTVNTLRYIHLIALVALSMAAGCETQGTVGRSGFLTNYWQLTPNPAMEGALYYQHPSIQLRYYNKFIVDPIVVQLVRKNQTSTIDPTKLAKLTSFFEQELIKALLKKQYQVVTQSGPGVLRVRAAITDIRITSPINLAPQAKLLGLGLGGASMEAELLDSQTGERLAAVVDSRTGEQFSLAGLGEFDHAKQVMKFWINRFMKRLDEARGDGQ